MATCLQMISVKGWCQLQLTCKRSVGKDESNLLAEGLFEYFLTCTCSTQPYIQTSFLLNLTSPRSKITNILHSYTNLTHTNRRETKILEVSHAHVRPTKRLICLSQTNFQIYQMVWPHANLLHTGHQSPPSSRSKPYVRNSVQDKLCTSLSCRMPDPFAAHTMCRWTDCQNAL